MAYKFNLPLDSELTMEQNAALYETQPIAIQGGPGTGKSVVSLKRHINNINLGKQSQLVTYSKPLTKFLEQSCVSAGKINAARCVDTAFSFTRQINGEIIIDEAQDLPMDVLNRLKSNSKRISFGADDRQQLYPDQGSNINDLKNIFSDTEDVVLEQNFRNTYSIMNFIRYLFPKKAIPQDMLDDLKQSKVGNKPIFIKYSARGNEECLKAEEPILEEIISDMYSSESNMAILVPLEKHVDEYYDMVSNMVPKCSKYHNGMDLDIIENLHVTTFKSAKGLEFDTVIIPRFGSHKFFINNMKVITESDYFVGLTRAKSNLYLLGNEDLSLPSDTYQ